uniref:Uncharacterized protein n=1 Tax=Aegilops tauschii subsp. strangulata TaxID=200361 RepID=A0A453H287_AEGTS
MPLCVPVDISITAIELSSVCAKCYFVVLNCCRIPASNVVILPCKCLRAGVISGNVIFGPPLQKYWAEKQQQEQAAKEGQNGST